MPHHHRSHPGQGSGQPRYPGSFLLALKEALARLNWQPRRWLGAAVECVDEAGREHVVGLENLYRRARREDRAAWPKLIFDFLASVPPEQLHQPPSDLAAVADRLLVRVGLPVGPLGEESVAWSQPLADPGLAVHLVIDYPQSMSYVTEKMVADSGQGGPEWLRRALDNLAARTPADWLHTVHEESGLRQVVVGDAYDSARALILERLLPAEAAVGYFAAIPGRDELFLLPVSMACLPHLPLLKVLAAEEFKKVPYPISAEVIWIHQGSWRPFPIHVGNEEITVEPPAEFVEICKLLVPDEPA